VIDLTVKSTERINTVRLGVEVTLHNHDLIADSDGMPMRPDTVTVVFTPNGSLAWAEVSGVAHFPGRAEDPRSRTSFKVGWGRSVPVGQAPALVTDLVEQLRPIALNA